MSNEKENVFNNMKTITKQDIQPKGEWIKQSIKLRNDLIEKKDSAVVFNRFDNDAIYHLFREYSKHPTKTTDEITIAKPLSQRIIGAHGATYDNNFFICRLLGYSVINLRLSHILDKPFKNRFYCNDQQHAFMYEYGIINQNSDLDLPDFNNALVNVTSENGTPEDNPILKEIKEWIEKAKDIGEMKWSQVKNSDKFPLIQEKMVEPLMVEFTYTYNKPATNKTQKINDNPYGWGDYQKLRNQLSHNENLYETVFTEDGNNLEYFHTHSLSNDFFGKDGKFIKKQYFATNAQPSNQEYTGEIEAAFLKLLMIFIDDNGKIDFTNNGIVKKDLTLIKDGSMYSKLKSYTDKWNKLDKQLTEKPEETKVDIKKLRTYFFDYLKGIEPLAKSKIKKLYNINKEFARVAKEYGVDHNHSKLVLNIKDMRLTKLENALWFIKNSIILSELYTEKTAQPIATISAEYVNIFNTNLDKFLSKSTKSDLLTLGSTSETRYEYLSLWNTRVFNILSDNLKNVKVKTDPVMRKKQNELFSIAKSRSDSFFDLPGYYFCPTQSIWLNDDNTDLGHDLLSKYGRQVNMDTIFIQNRSQNRKYNKGNFPTPKNYYINILNSYDNAISGKENVEPEYLSSMIESRKVLQEVVDIYENKEHLSI